MKSKIIFSVLLLFSVLGFIYSASTEENSFTTSPPPPNNNISSHFIIGAINTGIESTFNNWNRFDELGLNLWHIYSSPGTYNGRPAPSGWIKWAQNDNLDNPRQNYETQVNGVLDQISLHGMNAMMQRPRIEWLCYGQRSDYQCEDVSKVNPDLWFYTFQTNDGNHIHTGSDWCDNTTFGGNKWVKRCLTNPTFPDGPGYVVDRLKCNSEQCYRIAPGYNEWFGDTYCTWKIKPSIRADKNFVNAPQNVNAPICRVYVLNSDGNIFKDVILTSHNFFNENQNTHYNGDYIDGFNYLLTDTAHLQYYGDWGNKWYFLSRCNENPDPPACSHADIQVYWYGTCDMWIDRVRVDNDVANDLLSTDPFNTQHLLFEQWLNEEAEYIACHGTSPLKYYIELSEFNNIPCIAYVSQKLRQYTAACGKNINMVTDVTEWYTAHLNWNSRTSIFNAGHIQRNYINPIGATQFYTEEYPFTSMYQYPPTTTYSWIPSTLPLTSGPGILAIPVSPDDYDENYLQDNLDKAPYIFEDGNNEDGPHTSGPPQDAGHFRFSMKLANEVSKIANIPWIYMGQAHHWFTLNEVRREPTNEEMEMITNLSISYGAKGIVYYWYSWHDNARGLYTDYSYGFTEPANNWTETVPRLTNVYGQAKWDKIKFIIQRLKAWDPVIMNLNFADVNSYTYHTERTDIINNTYFSDIETYKSDINNPGIPSANPESIDKRLIQAATFKNDNELRSNYFMIVNRRCSPIDANWNDGRRDMVIQLKTNAQEFTNFRNYNIIDLESNNIVAPFDKTNPGNIDLGWFRPGEGKLYKIVPMMIEGGTLIADENIYSEPQFTIKGNVINNGHNITIGASSAITFTGTGHIEMQYGTLIIGDINGQPHTLTLTGDQYYISGPFISCTYANSVKIYNTDFTSVSNSAYYVGLGNNKSTVIQGCNFVCPDFTGAISAMYAYSSLPKGFTFSVQNNEFHSNSYSNPILYVVFTGGVQLPVNIVNNNFTSDNSNSENAIFLNNVSGGVVSNNHIYNYQTGINAVQSNVPLVQNLVYAQGNACLGLKAVSGSVFDMRNVPGYLLGSNSVSSMGSESHCIDVNNSYFLMNNGYNTFGINSDPNSYHLYGIFPDLGGGRIDLVISNNCFMSNSNPVNPIEDVTWYNGPNVDFIYQSSSCNINISGAGVDGIDIGSGITDTMALLSGHPMNASDSLGYEMRKREYPNVINISKRILKSEPDSLFSLDAVSKLFAASIAYDTSSSGITDLQDYLSLLIINNPNNITLARNCNYFVQKCKVLLHEYSSALTGFQQIIDQNPYSYEALVAHWDYMATALLDSISGGGEAGDGADHDKGKLTREQRQNVKETISSVFEKTKENEKKTIERLKDDASKGNVNAQRILGQKRTLGEVVKQKTPHTIFEHIKIVNDDIKKVFGNKVTAETKNNNIIPKIFKLYQNFPNPFNPTATIKYDLPKDVKVVIKIYDILGREVKKLVNEFKKAGSYEVDFNGTNLASGVYFYRIEAGDFVESKKMVLVK